MVKEFLGLCCVVLWCGVFIIWLFFFKVGGFCIYEELFICILEGVLINVVGGLGIL